jgi:hypothetical protein
MRKFRQRAPSPALLVSVAALFVALGGSSYAAIAALPANSVGTKQLQNSAVTTPKIANGAVTGPKMNFTGVTVPSASTANSVNADGVNTAAIQDGAVTASTLAGTYVATNGGEVSADTFATETATCNSGDRAIAGGYGWEDPGAIDVQADHPDSLTNPTGWTVTSRNESVPSDLFAWALCLDR